MLLQFVKRYQKKLVGEAGRFPLESRIFHALSIIVLGITSTETLLNLAFGLPVSALITFCVWLAQLFLFYQSRVKNRLNFAVVLSVIEVAVFNIIAYLFNSGITGSALMAFMGSLFVTLLIVKQRQLLWWFIMNLLAVLAVTITEYIKPNIILHHYQTRNEQFSDMIGAYLILMLVILGTAVQLRKSYEQQKQIADEKTLALQLLNAEKDKLFSIISHDLQAPLASVKQYLDVLTQVNVEPGEKVQIEKDLTKAIGNAQDLLTNLLKWAKNQMQTVAINLQPVALATLLTENFDLYENIAARKNITLTLEADEALTVKADTDMLMIIIRNLLNNAIKFTPDGGQVSIRAIQNNGCALLSVTDTGVGIAAHKQKELFSLKTTSTYGTANEKGTGLGLVLCHDYTQLQGGKIWFTSKPDTGTIFYVLLPLFETTTQLNKQAVTHMAE